MLALKKKKKVNITSASSTQKCNGSGLGGTVSNNLTSWPFDHPPTLFQHHIGDLITAEVSNNGSPALSHVNRIPELTLSCSALWERQVTTELISYTERSQLLKKAEMRWLLTLSGEFSTCISFHQTFFASGIYPVA